MTSVVDTMLLQAARRIVDNAVVQLHSDKAIILMSDLEVLKAAVRMAEIRLSKSEIVELKE